MVKLAITFILGFLFISEHAHASPEPIIDFSVEYYSVSGRTTDEINRSIFENTPIMMSGRRYGAVTKNDFITNFDQIASRRGGCEVRNVRVELKSKVILPKLTPAYQSNQVSQEWNRYLSALIDHEKLHANNARRTAETLVTRLFGLESDLPCDQMKVKLNQAIDLLVSRMGAWDLRLDQQTSHGAAQGAFLQGGLN
tara:strand:+ start:17759 stop:18349 length:591 start_codon:yes stop_codon:yes gene_type:complete